MNAVINFFKITLVIGIILNFSNLKCFNKSKQSWKCWAGWNDYNTCQEERAIEQFEELTLEEKELLLAAEQENTEQEMQKICNELEQLVVIGEKECRIDSSYQIFFARALLDREGEVLDDLKVEYEYIQKHEDDCERCRIAQQDVINCLKKRDQYLKRLDENFKRSDEIRAKIVQGIFWKKGTKEIAASWDDLKDRPKFKAFLAKKAAEQKNKEAQR